MSKGDNVFFTYGEVTDKGGRPPMLLTDEALKLVERYARVGATDEEIAGVLGCSRDVFKSEYNSEVYHQAKLKGLNQGLVSLRAKQYEKAMSGNPYMLRWVGIQMLHQSENIDVQANVGTDENAKLAQGLLDEIKKGKLTK